MSTFKRKISSLYCLTEKNTHTQVCYVSFGHGNMKLLKSLCYFLFWNIYYKLLKMCWIKVAELSMQLLHINKKIKRNLNENIQEYFLEEKSVFLQLKYLS